MSEAPYRSCNRNLAVTLALTLFLVTAGLAAQTAPERWICGLEPAAVPKLLTPDEAKRLPTEPVVLWQSGYAMLLITKGRTIPAACPEGRAVVLQVRRQDGSPAARVLVEWKPSGWPNLPEPFGRVMTDESGKAILHAMQGETLVAWIEEAAYLPMITEIPASSDSVALPLVPAPLTLWHVQGPSGRDADAPHLVYLDGCTTLNPLALAEHLKTLRKEVVGDTAGRLQAPPAPGGITMGWLWARGYRVHPLAAWPRGSESILLEPAQGCRLIVEIPPTVHREPPLTVTADYYPPDLPWLRLRDELHPPRRESTVAPMGYPCRITCAAGDAAPVRVDLHEPCDAGGIHVSMERGILLAGRVVDASGRPVPQASVTTRSDSRLPEALTDEKGQFHLPPLYRDMAPYTLTVRAEGFVPQQVGPLPARENQALLVRMTRGGEIGGRIVGERDLTPLPEGGVRVEERSGDMSGDVLWEASANAEGEFRLSGLLPGRYEVLAWAPRRKARSVAVTVTGAGTVDIGDLALSSHPEVSGSLVREDGSPAGAEAHVQLKRMLKAPDALVKVPPPVLAGTVGDDGSFDIPGVAPGRYRLVASEGEARAVKEAVVVDGEDVDVGTLTLSRGASVEGELTDSQPRDFSGWRVQLASQSFDLNAPAAACGADGSFSFLDVTPGTYRIQAFAPMRLEPSAMRMVSLSSGQKVKVTIPVNGLQLPILVQKDGLAVANAWVTISQASGQDSDEGLVAVNSAGGRIILGIPSPTQTAQTDASGYALVKGVFPGPAQATLEWNGMEYRLPLVIPDEVTSPLTLSFIGLTLNGRVVRTDGSPVADASVSLAFQGVGAVVGNTVTTDGQGLFSFRGLGEGSVTVTAAEASLHGSTTVALSADGPAPPPVTVVVSP
ncbi:MAG: carboxypeptidase regulatory-like domain-containing protein [Acidobacteriota bacterium]